MTFIQEEISFPPGMEKILKAKKIDLLMVFKKGFKDISALVGRYESV
jgi:hypothetical protein